MEMEREDHDIMSENIGKYLEENPAAAKFWMDLQLVLRHWEDKHNTDGQEPLLDPGLGLTQYWIKSIQRAADDMLQFYTKMEVDQLAICIGWNIDPESQEPKFKQRVLESKDIIGNTLEQWWILVKEKVMPELRYQKSRWKDSFSAYHSAHLIPFFDQLSTNEGNICITSANVLRSILNGAMTREKNKKYLLDGSKNPILLMRNPEWFKHYPEYIDFAEPFHFTGQPLEHKK
jgi:hypothetical protein